MLERPRRLQPLVAFDCTFEVADRSGGVAYGGCDESLRSSDTPSECGYPERIRELDEAFGAGERRLELRRQA
jgi:hypothetical protein